MSAWDKFWFNVSDFFTTTNAEHNRDMFGKLADTLSKGLSQIREEIDFTRNATNQIYASFDQNGQGSCGQAVTELATVENKHKDDTKAILNQMDWACSDIQAKISSANRQHDYWAEVVERERRERWEREERARRAREESARRAAAAAAAARSQSKKW